MIVTTVHIKVKKENLNEFIAASIENHKNSITEPGNLRFDILQSIENTLEFTFYEAYDSQESAFAHKSTSHYKKWKETVANFMEVPRIGKPHKIIEPSELSKWK